jgi:hypothetical protein
LVEVHRYFGGMFFLLLNFCWTTRRHIQDDSTLQRYRYDNFEPNIVIQVNVMLRWEHRMNV